MNIEVLKERVTPLLSRKRVSLMVEYKGSTPSRLTLKSAIAKQLKADEKLLVVRHIYVRFGQTRAKVVVNIYNDEKTMITLEGKKLMEKHSEKKPAAAEA